LNTTQQPADSTWISGLFLFGGKRTPKTEADDGVPVPLQREQAPVFSHQSLSE
jgi:hypothetical protein